MRFCTTCGARFGPDIQFCTDCGIPTQVLPDQQTPGTSGDPLLGRVIDQRYRIEKSIGEGGMGIVYLAVHTVLNKKLALKVLRSEMARDQDVVQRFIQEAQSASTIGHQNIIEISDFGRLPGGEVYFVMEHLDGEALTDLISRGGSLPMSDAIYIVQQIASALGAAHSRGIVHRDLKPDNIYLVKRGDTSNFVKVLDFGIAKVGGASSKLTRTGLVFGTPHYMSPEQAAGQSVDQRTDIYALGVIMYEIFTGKVPFDADTFMGILTKHMFESPIPPSTSSNRELGAIEDVIMKALSKKPEARYQNMDELVADLARVSSGGRIQIGGKPSVSAPGNLADALEPPSRTEMNLGMSSPPPPPSSKMPLVLGAIVAMLVVGGGIAGVVFALSRGGSDPIANVALDAGPVQRVPLGPAQTKGVGGNTALAAPDATLPTGVEAPARTGPIRVVSVPEGAEVTIDGTVVGNTPYLLERPTTDRALELRLAGFVERRITVSPSLPDVVTISLAPAPVAVTPNPPSGHRPRNREDEPDMSTMETPPPTMTREEPRANPSEVVDPWAG